MKPIFEVVHALLAKVEKTQGDSIRAAGKLLADTLEKDGLVHIFGTGHSHMLAEELFYRAGGLLAVNPILDPGLMLHVSAITSTDLERLEGYTRTVLNRYTFSPNDVMIVVSNSGRNAGPVEAALEAKRLGLPVIALTSYAYSQSSLSRHSSGKKLYELADVILDNGGIPGDAVVQVEGLSERICPTSTIIGATLLQAVVYEAICELMARGFQPAILQSANVDGGKSPEVQLQSYRGRIKHL